jgi:glucokinase
MEDWVVGIDLGATKIALGLIDPQNRIAARQRVPTAPLDGPDAAVERMAQAIDSLKRAMPAGMRLAGVGICSPGPLDHRTGMLLDPPNLTGWVNVPLRKMLADRLDLPVTLEHDAKAAALGEYHYGAGRGERDMVYIVVGTGVGSALILDGNVHRGRNNSAGEVGHITIRDAGDLCSCGNVGCVESFTSGPAIARAYRRALAATGEPEWVESVEAITTENIVERARGGETLAVQVLADAGEALGTAVATLAMILDVELYVIGSSVAKAGDLLLEPARRAVAHHAHRSVAARVRIVRSELEDDGPILGCGWLARREP